MNESTRQGLEKAGLDPDEVRRIVENALREDLGPQGLDVTSVATIPADQVDTAELIAREAGVIVTDPLGQPLAAPLDVFSDVAFVAYANDAIRALVDPPLRAALRARGLLPAG